MIIEALVGLIFGVIEMIILILPVPVLDLASGAGGLVTILAYGLYFFPIDIWVVVIGNGALMTTVSLGWAVIEWVYKKIPGVD